MTRRHRKEHGGTSSREEEEDFKESAAASEGNAASLENATSPQERKDNETEEGKNDPSCSLDDGGETSEPLTKQGIANNEIMSTESNAIHRGVTHCEYGYEEAAPEVQRRNEYGHFRRNSLVGRIMVWAGVVNDEHFSSENRQDVRQAPLASSRRASMDVAPIGSGMRRQQSNSIADRHKRLHSSDDLCLLDDEKHESGGQGKNYENTYAEYYDRQYDQSLPRRNSLHAMVERAVAYVNLKRDDSDDDLSPFGNRRDSLFA